ncbi:MAG: hypothetical protein ACHREM_25755, partial [Polyangiales bacterium]
MDHDSNSPLSIDDESLEHTPTTPRRSLPIYQAGGDHEPVFRALRVKEAAIAEEVAKLDLKALRRVPLLSANAKTSMSFDMPIGATCDPTELCARTCYALSPRAATTWRKSLRKRLRNLRIIELVDPNEVAYRLADEMWRARRRWAKRARFDFLRVNGTGDLSPALVDVLNVFAKENPSFTVWIVTRRFDLAPRIA